MKQFFRRMADWLSHATFAVSKPLKPHLRLADGLVLLAGALGMLLRIWLLRQGTDSRGLYPSNHISTTLLSILSLVLLTGFFLLSRQAGQAKGYRINFPASLFAALGAVAAAIGFFLDVRQLPDAGLLSRLVSITGYLSAAGLMYFAFCRFTGKRPHYLCLLSACVFLSLRLFYMGQAVGDDPELHRHLLQFLANIAAIVAVYLLWGFAVNDGNRKSSLFFSLVTVYFALASIPGNIHWPFFGGLALWLVTNLPILQLPVRRPSQPTPEAPTEPLPMPSETPAAEAEAPAAERADFDPDVILAELLKELDNKLDQES